MIELAVLLVVVFGVACLATLAAITTIPATADAYRRWRHPRPPVEPDPTARLGAPFHE